MATQDSPVPLIIHSESSQSLLEARSFRVSGHTTHSSSLPPSTLESPSIYVTFKVLQLVNAFRKRITRKHTARTTKKVSSRNTRDSFCQGFERQAFAEIDTYLGRKRRHPPARHSSHVPSKGIAVGRKAKEPASQVAAKRRSDRQSAARYVVCTPTQVAKQY